MARTARDGRRGGPPDAVKPRVLLKDLAYEQLKSLITTGAYPPGTFLSENMLATRLGMSKTPVRSAIERLEAAGFLAVSPQQGILVTALSLDEIIDHFEIRAALESYMMRRLAGRLTPAQLQRIDENLGRQLAAAEAGDLATYGQLDPEFHQLFCECLGNREITTAMLRLRDKLHRIISRVIEAHPDRMLSSHREHVAIVEALRQGDGQVAAARMEEHLERGRRFLVTR
jgi:GntR family transcriptional regulator, rspAB operon transcriptional repressor